MSLREMARSLPEGWAVVNAAPSNQVHRPQAFSPETGGYTRVLRPGKETLATFGTVAVLYNLSNACPHSLDTSATEGAPGSTSRLAWPIHQMLTAKQSCQPADMLLYTGSFPGSARVMQMPLFYFTEFLHAERADNSGVNAGQRTFPLNIRVHRPLITMHD